MMDGDDLGQELYDAIMGANVDAGLLSGMEQSKALQFLQIIGTVIVTHIQTNARTNYTAAEFSINPGTFNIGGTPVVGQGVNAVITELGTIS